MIFKARLFKKPKLIKDYFSIQSLQYSKYRPTYPKKLYRYLLSECRDRKLAWDVGTGNGQAAKKLSIYFSKIILEQKICPMQWSGIVQHFGIML